jgi:hypothetical protein
MFRHVFVCHHQGDFPCLLCYMRIERNGWYDCIMRGYVSVMWMAVYVAGMRNKITYC